MGGTLGRVVNTYADSDDDQLPLGVELVEANRHGEADFALEIPPAQVMPPGPVSPLLFGGNIFPNGDPSHPTREVMLPLLRRLASNTPQLSHTRTVICPFNVNKGSIKLIPRNSSTDMSVSSNLYDLYFTLDATEPCIVKVFYCVDEIFSNGSYVLQLELCQVF